MHLMQYQKMNCEMCKSKNSLSQPWLMKGKIQGTYKLSLALRWQMCDRHGSASEKYKKMIIQWIGDDMISFKYFVC